jgi:hypothetical protein
MPYTRREVRFLESSASPLTQTQKDKMNRELHDDPSLGHHTKGSPTMKKHNIREIRVEVHRDSKGNVTGHTVRHHMIPKPTKSPAFMEDTHESYPFGAKGEGTNKGPHLGDHIMSHLGMGDAAKEAHEEEEPGGEE